MLPIGVERDLVGGDVGGSIMAVGPVVMAFTPGGNVLGDEARAQFLGFIHVTVSANASLSRWIVDGDKALPSGGG